MQRPEPSLLAHYLKYRPWYAMAIVAVVAFVTGLFNISESVGELNYHGVSYPPWQPFVLEYSAALVCIAALPAITWFDKHFPITWKTWKLSLLCHLGAAAVFSVYRAWAIIGLRKLLYWGFGSHFEINSVPNGILFDYLPALRQYFYFLAVIYAYFFILRRLAGEASVLQAPDVGPPVESVQRPQRFLVRKLGKEFLIATHEIEWLQAQGNYVNLHVRGREYPLRSTMSAIQTVLDPNKFVRVHRSHIVNLDYLLEIEPLDTGDASLKLRDGTAIACSRTFRPALRERTLDVHSAGAASGV